MSRTKDSKNVKQTKASKLAQIAKEQSESRAYKLFSRSVNSPLTLKTYNKGLGQFRNFSSLSYDEIAKLDTEDLQPQTSKVNRENYGIANLNNLTELNFKMLIT